MADVITGGTAGFMDLSQVHRDVADMRHETAEDACHINDNVKSTGWNVADRVGVESDRVVAQNTAQFISGVHRDFLITIGNLKEHNQTQMAIATTSANTNMLIAAENQKTRDLMNHTTIDELRARLACCCGCGNGNNGNGNGNG